MRLLVILTSHDRLGLTGRKTGFYLPELVHVLDAFEGTDIEIDYASPKGGEPPMDGRERADESTARFLDDPSQMIRLKNTLKLSDANPDHYDAVYVPGGHGTMFDLPNDPDVQRLLSAIYEKGGVVSAVCHGPAALVNVKLSDGSFLVANRGVSAFTNAEEDAVKLVQSVPFLLENKLRDHGARYTKAANFLEYVVVDQRLITGQNPASAKRLGRELLKAMSAR